MTLLPPGVKVHLALGYIDKRRIVEETGRPGASLSEVARSYGIAARVLFRWKQDLAARMRSVLTDNFTGGGRTMSSVRERYDEAFWRAHHEAWQQSELNQREY